MEIEVTPLGEELQGEGEAVVRVIRKAEIDEDSVVLISVGNLVSDCSRARFAEFLREKLPGLTGRAVFVSEMPEFAVVRVKEKPEAAPVMPAILGDPRVDFLASPVSVEGPREDQAKGIGKGWPAGVPLP